MRQLARSRKLDVTSSKGKVVEYNRQLHEMLGGHQPGVLLPDAVGRPGEIERHDRYAVVDQARPELHRLARAHDPVGAGDHHAPARVLRPEDPLHERRGVGRERPVPEDVDHAAQTERLEGRLSHGLSHGASSPQLTLRMDAMPTSPAAQPKMRT